MFYASIIDQNNQPIMSSLELTASPAQYFAGCVSLLVDLLGGGNGWNKLIKSQNENMESIGTTFASKAALVMFIDLFHKHPAFALATVFDVKNINYPFLQGISLLMNKPVGDTSINIPLLTLVSKFKIPGIKSIKFHDDFTDAQRKLYNCNFPDELIPEEYLCTLSNQVMASACFDKRQPTTFFDKSKIQQQINQKGKNPYLNLSMNSGDIAPNEELQGKIDNFIKKVELIYQLYPKTYNDEYKNYKDQIQNETSLADFKARLESDIEKQKGSTAKDKVSATALKEKMQNLNPVKLYQEAVDQYKNHAFEQALLLLEQALSLFQQKSGKSDSMESFKCLSTIVSCHRELKNHDKAINYAENIISEFSEKFDISSVVKKYYDCLKLRGDKPEDIYQQAVSSLKNKNYALALNKLQFVLEIFDPTTQKAKLAYCYSTLASCYRELGKHNEAVTHCQKALSLREECLKPNDPLIKDTRNKLDDLEKLLSITNNTGQKLS